MKYPQVMEKTTLMKVSSFMAYADKVQFIPPIIGTEEIRSQPVEVMSLCKQMVDEGTKVVFKNIVHLNS